MPSTKAKTFVKQIISNGLIKEFEVNKSGKLTLKHSLSYLKSNYNLSSTTVDELQTVLAFSQNHNGNAASSGTGTSSGAMSPQLSFSGGKVYFTHSDVNAYLFAAASIGPAALLAALDGLAALTGPVGLGMAAVIDVLGGSSLASFTYMCIQAEYNNQGVYIGVALNIVLQDVKTVI